MNFEQKLLISVTILVIFVIIFTCSGDSRLSEPFTSSNTSSYYADPNGNTVDSTYDIKKYLIDIAPCHSSCCGDTFPSSYDGLTPPEIEKVIREQQEGTSNYVRTAYRCALGPRGVGCPCVSKEAYRFLASRGNNDSHVGTYIDPTYTLKRVNIPDDGLDFYQSERERVEIGETPQVETRLLNDITLQRQYSDLNIVSPYNIQPTNAPSVSSTMPLTKEQQVLRLQGTY